MEVVAAVAWRRRWRSVATGREGRSGVGAESGDVRLQRCETAWWESGWWWCDGSACVRACAGGGGWHSDVGETHGENGVAFDFAGER